MKIQLDKKDNKLSVILSGRLDAVSAPELESQLDLSGMTDLTLNMVAVDYVSSAGLRTILAFHKKMMAQKGKMTLTNLVPAVKEVFDMVGYSAILNIK